MNPLDMPSRMPRRTTDIVADLRALSAGDRQKLLTAVPAYVAASQSDEIQLRAALVQQGGLSAADKAEYIAHLVVAILRATPGWALAQGVAVNGEQPMG